MKLGLKRDEIKLADFTPEWNDEFIRIKKEILKNLNIESDRVEHIGSTAIKGMAAKPILDILIGVDQIEKVDKSIFTGLKDVGFLRLRIERPKEVVLAKFSDETYQEKTHYIHLVEFQKDIWSNLIFFRDYLNSNESERKKYLQIKMEYLRKSSTGISEYTDYKEAFVKNILNKK